MGTLAGSTDIKKVAYNRYIMYWLIEHGQTMDTISDMADDWRMYTNDCWGSLKDYIEEHGFNGEVYSCFEEFLDCEYNDNVYMREILNEEEYEEYLKEKALESNTKLV